MSAALIEPVASSPPAVRWLTVDACPSCGHDLKPGAALPDSGYVFGDERIEFPPGGIDLAQCSHCGLFAKSVLPHPHSLAQVFARQAGKKWMETYDFDHEAREIQRLVPSETFDVLDIGSGSGALLAALAAVPGVGRRSALDVVPLPGCAEHVRGEFIHGLIDSHELHWSGDPYDVVTLFDVAEHLYSPPLAFTNLRQLVKNGGLIVIETGNVESEWPVRYGAHRWWYARLFEHHVFWSRRALEHIAQEFGFELLIWREQRHKARFALPLRRMVNDLAQVGLYRVAPRAYPNVATLLGKYWTQPWSPFARDHFRVVLRKL